MPTAISDLSADQQQQLAMQQGATTPEDMVTVLKMLAEDPEALAAALQQIGIDADAEEIKAASADWMEEAADGASGAPDGEQQVAEAGAEGDGGAAEQGPPVPPSPATADEAEVPGDPDAEMEAMEAQAGATPQDIQQAMMAQAAASGGPPMRAPSGGGGMMPTRGGGNPIDDLISAQMMQGAAGNPNAPVPQVKGAQNFSRMKSPGIPRTPSRAASGGDPGMQGMIANLYRQMAAQGAANSRVGVPQGPRTRGR